MDENKRNALLKQLNGSPEEAAAAVRALGTLTGVGPLPDSALPAFVAGVKKHLEARQSSNVMRPFGVMGKLRGLLAPWRSRRDVAELAEELRLTKVRLDNVVATLKSSIETIERLYLHQAAMEMNLNKGAVVLGNLWEHISGEKLLSSAPESIPDPGLSEKIAMDVSELRRLFDLSGPSERNPDGK